MAMILIAALGNVWIGMGVSIMIVSKHLHKNLHSVNNAIWEVIRELHELENMDYLKEKLIKASGELCTELIIPIEREMDKKGTPTNPD